MNRRDALKTGVAVVTIPAILPAQKPRPSGSWKPAALDAHQNETVVNLVDLIIPTTDTPGAKQARVNEYIDLFLKAGPQAELDRFTAGLAWLDKYAQAEGGADFVKLPPAKQIAILEKIDVTESGEFAQGNQFFRMAKAMTSRFYYQTEIGYRELNKKGVPSGFGCAHPSHKG